jgi:predicted amidohydrolase YtcJ
MNFSRFFALTSLICLLFACNPSISASSTASPTALPIINTPTEVIATVTSPETADIIFTNGKIITMDAAHLSREGIAIQGNKILAVGTNEEINKTRGDQTIAIDLQGYTLMPGFVDAHNHLFDTYLIYDQDPLPDQEMAIEYGITTTADLYVDQSILNKLKALADADKLRMRVNVYLLYTTNCGVLVGDWWKAYQPNQQIAPNLFIRGIKIFADGGSCKAPAMSVEYPGGGMGDLFFTQEQLNQMVANVQSSGFQVAIHALGDRAVEQAQNAIAAVLNGQPNIYRHRIEHNATIRPDLLLRYSEIGIVPTIFGTYSTCIRTTGESKKFKYILPPEYGAWDWPWRALVDANPDLPIAWHSDYAVFDNINPLYHMWGMVTRKQVNTDGSICNPPDWLKSGALRIDEVLPMMTINAAYALFFDNEVGSLAAGKLADLVILSDNPLNAESDQIKDIKVLMTMIGGKVEWCAPGSESICPPASSTFTATPHPTSNIKVTASSELPNEPASNAFDGSIDTAWNSGSDPEQWIQIDLGKLTTVTAIHLVITQDPAGETLHQIWGGADANGLTLLHEFKGFTQEPGTLEFKPSTPLTNIRYVKIVTTQSPSWVAWREIEVLSP